MKKGLEKNTNSLSGSVCSAPSAGLFSLNIFTLMERFVSGTVSRIMRLT